MKLEWPTDRFGRRICTSDQPMPMPPPKGVRWTHNRVEALDTRSDDACSYRCTNCGHEWTVQFAKGTL